MTANTSHTGMYFTSECSFAKGKRAVCFYIFVHFWIKLIICVLGQLCELFLCLKEVLKGQSPTIFCLESDGKLNFSCLFVHIYVYVKILF